MVDPALEEWRVKEEGEDQGKHYWTG